MESWCPDEDEQVQSIRICVYERSTTSLTLEVNPLTLASEVCEKISTKLRFSVDEKKFYTLILVHTGLNESANANYHFLRTLKNDEKVLSVVNFVADKQRSKFGQLKSSYRSLSRWYYKDIRTSPIDLGDSGEISGESSSEDEESEISLDDMAYLRQGDRRGHLLKRSTKDPNLWKRRYCVLTDKIWCMNTRRLVPRAISIPLNSSILLQDTMPSFDYPHCIII